MHERDEFDRWFIWCGVYGGVYGVVVWCGDGVYDVNHSDCFEYLYLSVLGGLMYLCRY